MANVFDKIINDLVQLEFFSEYKFRKRDSSFFKKFNGGKQFIELDHWTDNETSSLVIYPVYGVRFDILHKWFEQFSVKSLQDQRDRASINFSGSMLAQQNEFYFDLNGNRYTDDFKNFQATLIKCADYVFTEYASLNKLYNKTIVPVLNGDVQLPDVGADWIFIYMVLCKLVNPTNFHKLKLIIQPHVKKMYARQEPNILDYYNRLEDIFHYLEFNKVI